PGSFGGARVKAVIPGSPGERAGIHGGDEVLAVDERATGSADDVIQAVQRGGVGHAAKLKLVDAKGHTRTVGVTFEARPDRESLQRHALVGREAPDFQPSVQAGAKLGRLSTMRGKVVVIDFFATWCGPCVEAMPHVEELHRKLGGKGLVVMGVSNESRDIVARAAERFHVTYPLASDDGEGVSTSYQVFALPTMVVIDRKGVVREVAISDTDAVDSAVAAALKDK
ncbi:MAG TPA: redoxin domain-containing protein, partial [Polyangia bacterium]